MTADAAARDALGRFETTRRLTIPLAVLHTSGDPIVPVLPGRPYVDKVEPPRARAVLTARTWIATVTAPSNRAELLAAFSAVVDSDGRRAPD